MFIQSTVDSWDLWITKPSGAVKLASNKAMKSWFRVRFENDVVRKTYSVVLDDIALATRVEYVSGFNAISAINNFQFRNLSADEDVYVDNVVIHDP